jgi:excisionase family DNA binding protein
MTRVQSDGTHAGENTNRRRLNVMDEPMGESVVATPRLLRIEEAAGCLGLSKRKTYELMTKGELQSVYIGRSRRITFAALQCFVDGLSHHRG